jgi:pimeloyl-ACP methyl ester carboxylesterase
MELGGPFTAAEPHVRRIAERIFDRTTDMAATQLNHYAAEGGPSIRGRLGTIKVPTLVIHGTMDPLFSLDHAEAFIREIPGARLLTLEGVGHEHPPAAYWNQVITALLEHTR